MLEDIIYAFFFCERKMWESIIFLKLSKEKNCEESFQINLGLEIQALGSHVKNALVRLRRHREDNKYDQRPTIPSHEKVS